MKPQITQMTQMVLLDRDKQRDGAVRHGVVDAPVPDKIQNTICVHLRSSAANLSAALRGADRAPQCSGRPTDHQDPKRHLRPSAAICGQPICVHLRPSVAICGNPRHAC
jgi:hypothetical protein